MSSSGALGIWLVAFIVFFAVCGFIGSALASPKGKSGAGFALGFLLGPIGIVVAALLSPSPEVQAMRDKQLAQAFASAAGPGATAVVAAVDYRKDAIAEALRRDPSLKVDTSPESLARLDAAASVIEREMALAAQVRAIAEEEESKARAEAEAVARAQEARDRQASAAAAAEATKLSEQRKAQERLAQLDAMSPPRRWMAEHKAATSAIGIAGLLLLAFVVSIPFRAAADRSAQEQLRAAEASASASAAAVASAEAVAASASASAASASASASAAAEAEALAARNTCVSNLFKTSRILAGCDLSKVNFKKHDISHRDFSNANLAGADLTGSITDGTVFTGVQWSNTTCPDGTSADVAADGSCVNAQLILGSLDRPYGASTSGTVGNWAVKIVGYSPNATDEVLNANQFNDRPAAGKQYAVVTVEATYHGQGTGSGGDLQFSFGTVSENYSVSAVVDNQLMDLYPFEGETITGKSQIYGPSGDLNNAKTIGVRDLSGGGSDWVYWKAP